MGSQAATEAAAIASSTRSTRVARGGLVVGGLLGLLVTPPFALAYLPAYGTQNGEAASPWLSPLREPLQELGLLGGDPVATYTRYGKAFGVALLLVTVSLAVVVRARRRKGPRETRAWLVLITGLGVLTLGTFGDYALEQGSFWANNGLGLELVGLLILAVATPLLGWALRLETGFSRPKSLAVALIGPASLILGSVLTAHIPSGRLPVPGGCRLRRVRRTTERDGTGDHCLADGGTFQRVARVLPVAETAGVPPHAGVALFDQPAVDEPAGDAGLVRAIDDDLLVFVEGAKTGNRVLEIQRTRDVHRLKRPPVQRHDERKIIACVQLRLELIPRNRVDIHERRLYTFAPTRLRAQSRSLGLAVCRRE